ncbi:XdhC family protein [Desulfosporosinus sp. SYSU MS00001]|uniref:XdhC family protein n=1 Tax=Desulfosporosinus sp. SYSU MS00001 TaxID=3416284 RepID=UPI003CF69825
MENEMIYRLKIALEKNTEVAMVTIISVLGSTPRKPGAKMIVFPDGTIIGTIGGGCGEAEARREALNVLAARTSKVYFLNMTADIAQDEGMVCGGIMGLFIDYLGYHNSAEQFKLYQEYLSALEEGNQNPILVTVIESAPGHLIGNKLVIKANGEVSGDLHLDGLNRVAQESGKICAKRCQPLLISLDTEFEPCETSVSKPSYRLLLEPQRTIVQLLILGGGHIALPLAIMAKIVGYEITVVDDRPAFANSVRFKEADTVICADFAQALERITITPQTFVVIVTRGHRYDKVCLEKVIRQPAAYIGMIGSRKRVKALKAELEEEGVSAELLQNLHSPIGLKIGAETPEEIAVSILSELINVQREMDQTLK